MKLFVPAFTMELNTIQELEEFIKNHQQLLNKHGGAMECPRTTESEAPSAADS